MSSETAYQGLLDMCTYLALCDGYICPKPEHKNCCLEITHSIDQLEYLMWKISLLENAGIKCGKLYFRKGKYEVRVRTQRHEIFNIVRKRLYDGNGRKHFSASVARRITPLYFAIMFMDNGSVLLRRSKKENKRKLTGIRNSSCIGALRVSLASFEIEEIENFRQIVSNKFLLDSYIVDKEKYPLLYFSQQHNIENFINLIKEFVPECMMYKINHPTSLHEKLPEETERRNIIYDEATVQ